MSVKKPRPQTPADDRTTRVGHGAKTAAVRERAILALLSEPTIGEAAIRCGIGDAPALADRGCGVPGRIRSGAPCHLPSRDQPNPSPQGARGGHARRVARRQRTPRRPARGGPHRWPTLACISTTPRRSCGSWTRSKPVSGGNPHALPWNDSHPCRATGVRLPAGAGAARHLPRAGSLRAVPGLPGRAGRPHARAVAAARAYRDVRGVTHVFTSDYDALTTCPRCAAPLP